MKPTFKLKDLKSFLCALALGSLPLELELCLCL